MRYFIDGYNLLFKILKKIHPLQKKRLDVIKALNQKVEEWGWDVTIVFDGSKEAPKEVSRGHFKSLEVVYTPKGLTADDYILETLTFLLPKVRCTVISSDRELSGRAKQLGAKTLSIEDFLSSLVQKKKIKKTSLPKGAKDSDTQFFRLLKIFEERLKHEISDES